MRLATWNCARGPWPRKRDALDTLGADIAIVTEAPRKATADGVPWFGDHLAQNGTTVVASPAYRLEVLPAADVPPCVNAVRVSGPQSFTLLTVWTWPAPDYKRPLRDGLEAYRTLPGPFVVAGDFNGSPCFDKPRTRLKWAECFAAVERLGAMSAYHTYTGEPYGGETKATHYFLRDQARPFHIDFLFIPTSWGAALRSVLVPGFEEFRLSDHRPVVVDLDAALIAG